MRILVDITEQQVHALNAIAKKVGRPRAQLIREALIPYLEAHQAPIDIYFGLWANNPETQDVQAYLDRIRGEWEE